MFVSRKIRLPQTGNEDSGTRRLRNIEGGSYRINNCKLSFAGDGLQTAHTGLQHAGRANQLLRDNLARAAKLCRKILQLGKAVFHRQYRLGIVDVNARLEAQRGNCRSKDVDQTEGRMTSQQVAATLLAVLARAERVFWNVAICSLPP